MFKFKNKKVNEVEVVDSWMRENFIPVPSNTSIKKLKPYQRMVILRKPEGEKKCIIDISLPYDEIVRLKQETEDNKYPNIFDKNILRIIPPTSEIEERFRTITKNDMEIVAQMLNDTSISSGDVELDSMSESMIDSQNKLPLIKMHDEKISISINEKDRVKKDEFVDKEIDNIDGVKFKIPLEEVYNQKWNDFDEYINNLDAALNEENSDKAIDNIANMMEEEPSIDQAMIDSVEQSEIVVQQENYETDYHDENDQALDDYLNQGQDLVDPIKGSQTPLTFFKSQTQSYSNLDPTQRVTKKVNFYKSAPASDYEKVVLNKKMKMITIRRKIDKSLLK